MSSSEPHPHLPAPGSEPDHANIAEPPVAQQDAAQPESAGEPAVAASISANAPGAAAAPLPSASGTKAPGAGAAKPALIGGVVGALVSSALYFGAPSFLPKPPSDPALVQQISSLQSAIKANDEALRATNQTLKALPSPEKPLAALDTRLKALETRQQPEAGAGAPPALAPLEARLSALEQSAAAPKAENRIAIEPSAGSGSGQPASASGAAALAVVAQALAQNVSRGQPFALELDAAESLGIDHAKLETLRPFAATGLPTPAALVASLAAAAKAAAPAASPPATPSGVWQRITNGLANSIKIRTKDSPAEGSLAAINSALNADNFAQALELQAHLPAPLQEATKSWAESLANRQKAEAVAQSLWAEALKSLAKPKN